jgi:hypothetical protein
MKTLGYIRMAELGVALASTYMTAVTMIQTSIYGKLKPYAIGFLHPILEAYGIDPAYIDIILLGLVIALSFKFWQRGDEAGFGRLFSLNMLMFFPAAIDFSMFNWVNLILPYDPMPRVSVIWAFAVGLLLQATYLFLRYTVRFRLLQDELLGRGAEQGDVDEVTKGQIYYLASLVFGTAAISAVIYYVVPFVVRLVSLDVSGIPYPHIVIGVACILLIAAAIVYYLRGGKVKDFLENAVSGAKDLSTEGARSAPDRKI